MQTKLLIYGANVTWTKSTCITAHYRITAETHITLSKVTIYHVQLHEIM